MSQATPTTVEFHNRTPFPVKIVRKAANGSSYVANALAGYARYVQSAAPGEKLSVKLDCNGWSVKTVTAGNKPKVVVIDDSVLRSRPGKQKVAVKLDVPVRNCVLVKVDGKGAERKLRATIDHKKPAPTVKLEVGTVIKGMDPDRRFTYFWLIVTPKGTPNQIGQSFSTGTGWGVVPDEGEVVLFVDLGLGRKAGYKLSKAPSQPFYLHCHADVPDLAALLDSRLLDFPDDLRTVAKALEPGSSAAAAATIYERVERYVPRQGARTSGGVVVVGARVGPNTRAVFYESAGLAGETFELEDGALPAGRALRSLNLETTRTAAQAGMRVLTTLSEDYLVDDRGKLVNVSRYRVALTFDSAAVDTVQVSAWDDDVKIIVQDVTLTIGPDRPATLKPNPFNRVMIAMEAGEDGASELLVRTNVMPPGTVVTVFPDQEMHDKMARMDDGALHGSGIVDGKYSAKECAEVQKALSNISRTVVGSYAETPVGVQSQRRYDADEMADAHWVLTLDPGTGKLAYGAISAAEADAINAETADEIHDVDRDIAQGLKKKAKKAKKKAKKTTSKATKATKKTTSKATKSAEKTTKVVVKSTEKTATKAAVAVSKSKVVGQVGDAVVDVGKDIQRGYEVTIHYANKTAVRFVVKTAKQAWKATVALLELIEVAFDKFIEWIRFLFDWGDIKRTQEVYAEAINHKLDNAQDEIAKLQDQMGELFADLRKKINKAKSKTRAASDPKESTSPSDNSGKEKSEWIFNLLLGVQSGSKKSKGKSDKGLADAMKRALADMASILEGFGALFDAMVSGDAGAMAKAAKDMALDFALLGCDVVQALADAILTVAKKVIGAIAKFLNTTIKIPIITQLYKWTIGGKLTLVNLCSFVFAVISTVIAKVFAGKAPFGPKDSLVQASGLTIAANSTLAALDLAYGFLGAKSTLEAGADPLSPKNYADPLWKVMFVLKTGGMLEAIVQPFIIKEDAAELLVSFSGALKSFGQLALQWEPSNTRRAEILLEAFFGGALKFVAGGLEYGTHKSNATVLFLEGTGALVQVGGMMSNPDVYTPAAGVSMVAYTWAMVARLVQLTA